MTNFGAKIFNNAVSAIWAQQALIASASNNIANVNTEGYARRILSLQTRLTSNRAGGINVGAGVEIGQVTRASDQFLDKLAWQASGKFYSSKGYVEFLDRVENMFGLTGDRLTIGSTLTDFFNAANDLSLNPASIELRANFIERAQDLVSSLHDTYATIANLQGEADDRLGSEIQTVNAITSQIADLNGLIATREQGGTQLAADERDRRAILLDQLADHISFDHVENSDGSVNISLSNGFPLVSGTVARSLEVTQDPSFGGGTLPPSLNGEVLSYVVYDYDTGAGTAHIDLTQYLAQGEGTVGGLLQMRGYADPTNTSAFEADGYLVEFASRVESITRTLLTTFNETYRGPGNSAQDLDGNTPGVFGLFDFNFAGVKDANGNGIAEASDLAASGIDNFSSILQLSISDPRAVAAARDPGDGSFSPGDASNLIAIADLQTTSLSFSAGSYSRTGTFGEVYNELVGRVGNLKNKADVDFAVAQDNLVSAQNRRDEVQGVSLDEEFTQLVKYQKAFEANAKIVRIGSDLLDTIVGLI